MGVGVGMTISAAGEGTPRRLFLLKTFGVFLMAHKFFVFFGCAFLVWRPRVWSVKAGISRKRCRKFDLSNFQVVKVPGAILTAAPPAKVVESHMAR
jgi:hypothetical protein